MYCSGKASMEHGLPDERTFFSMEGSAAHFLGAECLIKKKDTVDYIGAWIAICTDREGNDYECFEANVKHKKDPHMKFEVTDEMAEYVQVYVDHVRSLTGNGSLFVENRVCFGALTGIGDAFGTSDTIILSEDYSELTIVDLKYGYRRVSAARNKQMFLYAIGALDFLSPLIAPADVLRVKLVIVQPRINNIDTWECSLAEVVQFGETVKPAHDLCVEAENSVMTLAKDEWMELYVHPSEKGCEWCRAKPFCPRLAKSVLVDTEGLVGTHLDGDFADLDFSEGYEIAIQKFQELPIKELADAYSFVHRHQLFIDAIEKAFYDRMVAGEKDYRYKLVPGRRGNRKWVPNMLTERKRELANDLNEEGFKLEAMYLNKLISPTEADKVFKKFPDVLTRLSKYVVHDEPKPVLTDYLDKRASWADESDFKNLSGDPNLVNSIAFDSGDDI